MKGKRKFNAVGAVYGAAMSERYGSGVCRGSRRSRQCPFCGKRTRAKCGFCRRCLVERGLVGVLRAAAVLMLTLCPAVVFAECETVTAGGAWESLPWSKFYSVSVPGMSVGNSGDPSLDQAIKDWFEAEEIMVGTGGSDVFWSKSEIVAGDDLQAVCRLLMNRTTDGVLEEWNLFVQVNGQTRLHYSAVWFLEDRCKSTLDFGLFAVVPPFSGPGDVTVTRSGCTGEDLGCEDEEPPDDDPPPPPPPIMPGPGPGPGPPPGWPPEEPWPPENPWLPPPDEPVEPPPIYPPIDDPEEPPYEPPIIDPPTYPPGPPGGPPIYPPYEPPYDEPPYYEPPYEEPPYIQFPEAPGYPNGPYYEPRWPNAKNLPRVDVDEEVLYGWEPPELPEIGEGSQYWTVPFDLPGQGSFTVTLGTNPLSVLGSQAYGGMAEEFDTVRELVRTLLAGVATFIWGKATLKTIAFG